MQCPPASKRSNLQQLQEEMDTKFLAEAAEYAEEAAERRDCSSFALSLNPSSSARPSIPWRDSRVETVSLLNPETFRTLSICERRWTPKFLAEAAEYAEEAAERKDLHLIHTSTHSRTEAFSPPLALQFSKGIHAQKRFIP